MSEETSNQTNESVESPKSIETISVVTKVVSPSTLVPPPILKKQPEASDKQVIGRLTKIEIENYRAFRGRFELDLPNGCNLLIYGENGAGKSSLFNVLTDFLESPDRLFFDGKANNPLKHDDYRHRFNSDPSSVCLTFNVPQTGVSTTSAVKKFEWSKSKNDPKTPEMRSVNKGKGCLDYRALLRVHLLPTGAQDINLFGLFMDTLLANYKNPASTPSRAFAEEWKEIQKAFVPYAWKPANLDNCLKEFNAGFERVAKDTIALASKLLSDFDNELAVEIEYIPASYKWRPKKLVPPKIIAKPYFRRIHHHDYHSFLNEARLSALAIAIYFAGLKEAPVTDFRLLVLDDILIGLDMANRMTVLGMIEKLFKGWQVIIMTYHKAWFEVLNSRTNDGKWQHPWKSVTIRSYRALGVECPIVVSESGTLLARARTHFDHGDVKAAAVYARSAWEQIMSWYCEEWRLPVTYVESRRKLDTNDFLNKISKHLENMRNKQDREFALGVLQEIRHTRRFVLNPSSHFDPDISDVISAEIADGIRAVEDFEFLLRSLSKKDFLNSNETREKSKVGEIIIAALDHHVANRSTAALDAMNRAFEQHLDEFFRLREELVPYGTKISLDFLFTLSGRRKLFAGLTWKRLRHAQAYLVGTMSPEHLTIRDFESAARLFLHLRLNFILRKMENKAG